MGWTILLAYINQLQGRVRLSDGEHTALVAIGQKLVKRSLEEAACHTRHHSRARQEEHALT